MALDCAIGFRIRNGLQQGHRHTLFGQNLKQGAQKQTGVGGAEVKIQRVLPYFKRSDIQYSSHFQTPPMAEVDAHPALVTGERFAVFADPVFLDVRKSGTPSVPSAFSAVLRDLIGPPPAGDGLSKRIELYPLRKGNDLLLTLLHYVPVRKSVEIDVIDEPSTFADQTLVFDRPVAGVRDALTGDLLPTGSSSSDVRLPARAGRLRLVVEGYFA